MPGITYSNPFWYAKIYAWDEQVPEANVVELGKGRSGGDIVNFSWSKHIDSKGSLELQLVPHKTINYKKIIKPNSPVEFWLDGGRGVVPVMFAAWVDRVANSKGIDPDGKVQNRIIVSCRDATKLLDKQAIFYNPQYNKSATEKVKLGKLASTFNFIIAESGLKKAKGAMFNPVEYFWVFLDSYLKIASSFLYLPVNKGLEELKFSQILDINSYVASMEHFPFVKAQFVDRALGTARTLWELMSNYSHAMLNEFFIDCRSEEDSPVFSARNKDASNPLYQQWADRKPEAYFSSGEWAPRVIFRPRPYLLQDMAKLPRRKLNASDITEENIGFSDHDVKNYFRVSPVQMGVVKDLLLGTGSVGAKNDLAIINGDSIVRFGLNKFEPSSDFCHGSEVLENYELVPIPGAFPSYKAQTIEDLGKSVNWKAVITIVRKQTEILAVQHCRNEQLLNGNMTTASVMPWFFVGDVIEYKNDLTKEEIAFYLEGVSHRGEAGGRTNTNLAVIRGVPLKELEAAKNATDYVEATIDKFDLNWITTKSVNLRR